VRSSLQVRLLITGKSPVPSTSIKERIRPQLGSSIGDRHTNLIVRMNRWGRPLRRARRSRPTKCDRLVYEMGYNWPVTGTDITVWTISALLALGVGWSRYAKWKTRDKIVRELAAMDPERREKLLSRMTPQLAMEARQELMRRFHIG